MADDERFEISIWDDSGIPDVLGGGVLSYDAESWQFVATITAQRDPLIEFRQTDRNSRPAVLKVIADWMGYECDIRKKPDEEDVTAPQAPANE